MTRHDRHDQGAQGEFEPPAPARGPRKRYSSPALSDFGALRSLTQGGATAVAGDILPSMRMVEN
ncbi:MAG TPA: hypothetical protein PLM09_04625 [Casimicrobiaceae bacterium]|nr:hypothetical protein [Casimicrobiaceae bacterium]